MMMNSETIENAKRACLKQSFGGALSSHESELLDSYLETAAGEQYLNDSNNMKRLLGDVAEVRITASVDGAAMITAFESMARDDLRASRRRLPLYLALSSGLWLLTGGICLSSGQADLQFFGWTMLAGAPVFAVLCVALWHQQGAMIEGENLLQRMDEDRELGKSKAAIIVSAMIGLAMFGVLGVGIAKAAGPVGLVIGLTVWALLSYAGSIVYKRKRRRHQELWDWWDGRES